MADDEVDLASQVRAALYENGSITVETAELGVTPQAWRAAARRAGRDLGRPVRTGLGPGETHLWAALTDWPANPKEERHLAAQLRRVAQAAAGDDLAP